MKHAFTPVTPEADLATNADRRGWLKRLGAVLGLGLLAGKATAAPQGVRQVNGTQDYIGEIMLFAGSFAPQNYLPCDGRLLPINQFSPLFALIGTSYGGNGVNNFALPDLRNRVPRGSSSNNGYADGYPRGQETVTLTSNQLPAHSHRLNVSTTATSSDPAGNFPAVATGTLPSSDENVTVQSYGTTATGTANLGTIGIAGGNQPVSVLDPYIEINYVICVSGIFPVRP